MITREDMDEIDLSGTKVPKKAQLLKMMNVKVEKYQSNELTIVSTTFQKILANYVLLFRLLVSRLLRHMQHS